MTQNTPPPATTLKTTMPSQDDRLLAACAHLSFLTGFWLIAPIAIYVIKRKESRFVAFTALQAVMVQVLFGVGMTGGCISYFVLMAVAGVSQRPELAIVAVVAPFVGLGLGGLALVGVHAIAALSAWRGSDWKIPIAGRIAEAIQNADEGAVKS